MLITGDDGAGLGTGWVLDAERGLIVTNAHVAEATTRLGVVADSSNRSSELIALDYCDDVALLQVEDTGGLEPLPLGDQAALNGGSRSSPSAFPGPCRPPTSW